MPGRARLPIGTHGEISVRELEPGKWEADCRYRNADGTTKRYRRQGKSKAAATANLKKALAARGGDTIDSDMSIRELAQQWLEKQAELVDAGDLAPRTLATYESAMRNHVLPGLGELRLREATTAACERWLVALRRSGLGPSMCATARKVLSGILGLAARMEAIRTNPVRDLSRIPGSGQRKRKPRAMTREERAEWLAWLDNNVAHDPALPKRPQLWASPADTIKARALGDIVRLQLATGCRIGEAMALSWDDVNLSAGTVEIGHHLVRVKGRGLYRQPGAKSEAGHRVLRLPNWAANMLMQRWADSGNAVPVFPDTLGQWRDPNLVIRWMRWSRDEAGFEWLTSHVYRQTMITMLDEAGMSTREVADQAGHSHVSQTARYMERRVASNKAAEVLEGML